MNAKQLEALGDASGVLEALAALLTNADLTQVATATESCGVPTLAGTPCTRSATTEHGTCKTHTPERIKARDERVERDEAKRAAYLANSEARSQRQAANRKAAAIATSLGFSNSGPEWAYARDGLLEGKDEALIRATLADSAPTPEPETDDEPTTEVDIAALAAALTELANQ